MAILASKRVSSTRVRLSLRQGVSAKPVKASDTSTLLLALGAYPEKGRQTPIRLPTELLVASQFLSSPAHPRQFQPLLRRGSRE